MQILEGYADLRVFAYIARHYESATETTSLLSSVASLAITCIACQISFYLLLLSLLLLLLLLLKFSLFFHHTSEQHTYTSSEHFYLEEGESRNHQKATKNFRAPDSRLGHENFQL